MPQSGFSLNLVYTSSTKICVSFTFRCALIFVDTYAHTLFLEVNSIFQSERLAETSQIVSTEIQLRVELGVA
jgi:hypothetical protein